MEFQVEIGVWKISQNHETLGISFFKYGRVIAEETSDRIWSHTQLYNRLSEFVVRENQKEEVE